MLPDISTGPMVAAGAGPGRAFGPATGPPGGDPLAALFAALLAHSDGAPPPTGAASSLLKAALKPGALPKTGDAPVEKTQDNLSAALPTLPLLLTSISMVPISMMPTLPPTAGALVEQKTGTKKTMDTSPLSASPITGSADTKSGGELPLQDARIAISGASTPLPAFFIASPMTASPMAASPIAASPLPGVAPSASGLVTAPVTSPGTSVLGAAAVPLPTENVPQARPAVDSAAPAVVPSPAPSQPGPAGYALQSQGFVVATDALLGQVLPQAVPAAVVQTQALGEAKAQAVGPVKGAVAASHLAEASGVTAATALIVMDGKAAKDGGSGTDAPSAREGETATEGEPATEGRMLTGMDSRTLTRETAPEKALKSATLPADTITGSRMVPVKALPTEIRLPVIGRRSERRAESAGGDTPVFLPTAAPAQIDAARTEAKPLTATDRAEIIRQVADGVSAMPLPAKPGASEQMTLQLHPKDWGQLQVSVKITPGSHPSALQAVTAHIVAETPQVKAALENHSGDLRQALREAGLNLDRISVTVQSTDASAQAGTATSGGHHEAHGGAGQGTGGGAFGETTPQKTGMSSETRMWSETGMSGAMGNGMPSFAASGGSHGGRQGGEPPPAYAAAYAPAETEDAPREAPRRPASGQIDIRA